LPSAVPPFLFGERENITEREKNAKILSQQRKKQLHYDEEGRGKNTEWGGIKPHRKGGREWRGPGKKKNNPPKKKKKPRPEKKKHKKKRGKIIVKKLTPSKLFACKIV